MNRPLSPQEEACARRLWSEAGFPADFLIEPLAGGANNRVYRLSQGEHAALLKVYYSAPDDPRDRLGAEVAFTRFLDQHGITAAPRPLAWDRQAGMALYEFMKGRKLTPAEVTKPQVLMAAEFVLQINQHRSAPDAAQLPNASEACFSIAEHLACVECRVDRLATIGDASAIDRDARRFVEHDLRPRWTRVRDRAITAARAAGIEALVLRPQERCLSPSDFGLHNALVDADGRLRFFDFEYAGWDDPAKLVCDFFCQVELPAPRDAFEEFAVSIGETVPDPAEIRQRIELLLPVYGLKWCCILLNEFLPPAADRRRFSRGEEGDIRKSIQLAKARELFKPHS